MISTFELVKIEGRQRFAVIEDDEDVQSQDDSIRSKAISLRIPGSFVNNTNPPKDEIFNAGDLADFDGIDVYSEAEEDLACVSPTECSDSEPNTLIIEVEQASNLDLIVTTSRLKETESVMGSNKLKSRRTTGIVASLFGIATSLALRDYRTYGDTNEMTGSLYLFGYLIAYTIIKLYLNPSWDTWFKLYKYHFALTKLCLVMISLLTITPLSI